MFHSRQPGHWPRHCGVCVPQDEQAKISRVLAMRKGYGKSPVGASAAQAVSRGQVASRKPRAGRKRPSADYAKATQPTRTQKSVFTKGKPTQGTQQHAKLRLCLSAGQAQGLCMRPHAFNAEGKNLCALKLQHFGPATDDFAAD